MTPRASRYRAVISTYRNRLGFKVLGALTAIDIFILSCFALALVRGRGGLDLEGAVGVVLEFFIVCALFAPYILFVVFVTMMMHHLREQLFNPRAALVPGFIKAHLVVGCTALVLLPVLALLGFIGAVSVMDSRDLPNLPGVLGILLFALAVTAWMASFRSAWYALFVLPVAVLFLVGVAMGPRPLENTLSHLADGTSPSDWWVNLQRAFLLGVDVLLLTALFHRLGNLSRRDVDEPRAFFRARAGRTTALPVPLGLRPHRVVSSPLLRAWHRRSGIISPLAPWVVALSLGSLLLIVTSIFKGENADFLRSLLFPTLAPGVVISLIWRERWMNLGYESLYPADRGQFLDELLGATAISLAELWIATVVAVLPPVLIHRPQLLGDSLFLVSLVASAAMQFMVFGIMFLSALFRPLIPYVNVLTIVAQLIPIALAWGERPQLSQRGLLTIAGFEMLVGILITTLGYRNWRRADLA